MAVDTHILGTDEAVEAVIAILPDQEWVRSFVDDFNSREAKALVLHFLVEASRADKWEEGKELILQHHDKYWVERGGMPPQQAANVRGTLMSRGEREDWLGLFVELGLNPPKTI